MSVNCSSTLPLFFSNTIHFSNAYVQRVGKSWESAKCSDSPWTGFSIEDGKCEEELRNLSRDSTNDFHEQSTPSSYFSSWKPFFTYCLGHFPFPPCCLQPTPFSLLNLTSSQALLPLTGLRNGTLTLLLASMFGSQTDMHLVTYVHCSLVR